MLTAPQLFAAARGTLNPVGTHRCFYCGGVADESMPAAEHVKPSFTARDTVCGGEWVCTGCVESQNEQADVVLANGTRRTGQRVRLYSWVLSQAGAVAATKANRDFLLDSLLSPPEPPWCISLSDSGQKHLLYRAVVNHTASPPFVVTLEGEPIEYRPEPLTERLTLCRQVAAVCSVPGLREELQPMALMRLIEHFADDTLPARWQEVCQEPLTRLAIWFTPSREECLVEFPGIAVSARGADDGGVPPEAGGTD